MPVAGAIIGGVASIGGSLIAGGAAKSAANAQADAARYAADIQMQQYQQSRQDLAPWREAGAKTLGELVGRLPELTAAPNPGDFRTDPGYQFALDQGLRGVQNSAAARGGLMSGGTLKDLMRYGQGLADQQYGDWWNRQRAVQGDTFNRYASIAGVGQTATNTLADLGAKMATNAGNAAIQGGNARASGYAGQAAAFNNGLSNLAFMAQNGAFGGGGGGPVYTGPYANLAPSAANTIRTNPSIF